MNTDPVPDAMLGALPVLSLSLQNNLARQIPLQPFLGWVSWDVEKRLTSQEHNVAWNRSQWVKQGNKEQRMQREEERTQKPWPNLGGDRSGQGDPDARARRQVDHLLGMASKTEPSSPITLIPYGWWSQVWKAVTKWAQTEMKLNCSTEPLACSSQDHERLFVKWLSGVKMTPEKTENKIRAEEKRQKLVGFWFLNWIRFPITLFSKLLFEGY